MTPPRWRRLMGSEAVTEPIPLATQLRGTPYSDLVRMQTPEQQDLRRSLDLVMGIAALGLRAGAGTAEVKTTVLASAAALGLRDDALEVDITFGSVLLGYAPPGQPAVALVRVVPSPGRDYSRMSEVHALVVDLVEGRLDRSGANRRLEEIRGLPRPYHRGVVSAAWGGLAATVVALLGGTLAAAGTAFVVTAVVDQVGRFATRRGLPAFFVTYIGAALAAALALLVGILSEQLPALGLASARGTGLVVAGGIITLLAGVGLVAAVQDGISGFPVTAVGRLFSVMLTTAAILAGVATAFTVAAQFDLGSGVLVDPLAGRPTDVTVTAVLLAALGATCSGLASRAPPRVLVAIAVAGGIGFQIDLAVRDAGLPAAISAAVACTFIGVVGRVWALRRRASPLAVVVPATTMLLPGLVIFQALREMTTGDAPGGLITLLSAGTIAMAIAGGVVLGDTLAAPVERGLDVVEARRRGERLAGARARARNQKPDEPPQAKDQSTGSPP